MTTGIPRHAKVLSAASRPPQRVARLIADKQSRRDRMAHRLRRMIGSVSSWLRRKASATMCPRGPTFGLSCSKGRNPTDRSIDAPMEITHLSIGCIRRKALVGRNSERPNRSQRRHRPAESATASAGEAAFRPDRRSEYVFSGSRVAVGQDVGRARGPAAPRRFSVSVGTPDYSGFPRQNSARRTAAPRWAGWAGGTRAGRPRRSASGPWFARCPSPRRR